MLFQVPITISLVTNTADVSSIFTGRSKVRSFVTVSLTDQITNQFSPHSTETMDFVRVVLRTVLFG